jgi:hypothetical protein
MSGYFNRNLACKKTGMIIESLERKRNYQPRILYTEIWYFKNEGKIKIFLHNQHLRGFIITRLATSKT